MTGTGRHRRALRSDKRRRHALGFGLLEAIVAMTILAVSGGALFAWIAQNLATATRLKQNEARVQQLLLAEGLVASVNPFVEPEGERQLGPSTVRWRAELVAPFRPSIPSQVNEPVTWRVGLYRLRVEIRNPDIALSDSFEMLQTGLEPVGAKVNDSRLNPP